MVLATPGTFEQRSAVLESILGVLDDALVNGHVAAGFRLSLLNLAQAEKSAMSWIRYARMAAIAAESARSDRCNEVIPSASIGEVLWIRGSDGRNPR